jgi:hypothetical protein
MCENHPRVAQAIIGLWLVEDSLRGLLEYHQATDESVCRCWECVENIGRLWAVQNVLTAIESDSMPVAPQIRRLRATGFPPADVLAHMILSYFDAGNRPETPEAPDTPDDDELTEGL